MKTRVSACQYSFWNAVTFGAEKFQVDAKEGEGGRGGGGVLRKSEYVDGPLLIPVHAQGSIDLVV